ncbi:hypothetical protein Tco_0369965 [Tanacetum coccineum]
MLEKGSYIPWSSIFLRCIYGKKDYGKKYYGKMLKESILHGPYQMKEITYQGNPAGNPRVPPFQRYHKETNLTSDVDLKNLLDRVSSCTSLFSLPKRLKADNTIRVNQLVTILLIESLIHRLDQIQYPDYTSLIHIESRKSPTAVLFDVDTGRISIRHCETKEYHSVFLARSQG